MVPRLACPKVNPTNGPPPPGSAAAIAAAKLATAIDELRGAGATESVSVSIENVGEVVAVARDTALVPASNQKLLIAMAALELLGPDVRLHTSVVAAGPIGEGVLTGDLVLIGGGDPTLLAHAVANPAVTARSTTATITDPSSLDALVAQLATLGIHQINGRILVDESRFDDHRTAPGWPANWTNNIGALSALVVDKNRGGTDPDQYTDPALAAGRRFESALKSAGIATGDDVAHVVATVGGPLGLDVTGLEVAGLDSPPLGELVAQMLSRSDNLIAETLTKELGRRVAGSGTTAAGLLVARQVADGLCVRVDGADADGSGLSPGDTRSAGAWRRLLEVARTRPWWPVFRDGLAVAGQSGTLAARLLGGATAGRVRAKTGSTATARALSGYLTAANGRQVTFSVIVNTPLPTAEKDIDRFVTALATQL